MESSTENKCKARGRTFCHQDGAGAGREIRADCGVAGTVGRPPSGKLLHHPVLVKVVGLPHGGRFARWDGDLPAEQLERDVAVERRGARHRDRAVRHRQRRTRLERRSERECKRRRSLHLDRHVRRDVALERCVRRLVDAERPDTTVKYILRETLRRVATPQAYQFGLLDEKYHEAFEKKIGIYGSSYTNTMMTELGVRLYFAAGSDRNIKLTTPGDIEIFKAMIAEKE